MLAPTFSSAAANPTACSPDTPSNAPILAVSSPSSSARTIVASKLDSIFSTTCWTASNAALAPSTKAVNISALKMPLRSSLFSFESSTSSLVSPLMASTASRMALTASVRPDVRPSILAFSSTEIWSSAMNHLFCAATNAPWALIAPPGKNADSSASCCRFCSSVIISEAARLFGLKPSHAAARMSTGGSMSQ